MGNAKGCMMPCSPDPPGCALPCCKLSLAWDVYSGTVGGLIIGMMRGKSLFTVVGVNLNLCICYERREVDVYVTNDACTFLILVALELH